MGMSADRPNVLLIMTDQQRYDTLGVHGNPVIKTPHLDELAGESALFEHFYVTNPVCVPSRASFLTGRYPTAHRARDLKHALGEDEQYLPGLLGEAGYALALSGKNHVLSARQLDRFDDVFSIGHDKAWIPGQEKAYGSGVDPSPLTNYSTNVVCERAIGFLESRQRTDEPFFLWVSFPDPHTPYQVPEPFASMYDSDGIPGPTTIPGELEGKPLPQRLIQKAQSMDTVSEREVRQMISIYYGMVSCIDEAVGRLLGRLRELGLEEDTVVIFTSDHGDFMGDHGLARKSWNFYDCLLRVPFMVRWIDHIEPWRVSDTMAENVDLLPTVLDLIGLPIPEGCQGRSMAPLLQGEKSQLREAVFANAGNPGEAPEVSGIEEQSRTSEDFIPFWYIGAVQGSMIRTMDWKLCFYVTGDGELYDLQRDPVELHNLYGQPQVAETERELMRQLMTTRMRAEDPHPSSQARPPM
jgi:arylsulfatase